MKILIFVLSLGLFLAHNETIIEAAEPEDASINYLTIKKVGAGVGTVLLSTGVYTWEVGNTAIAIYSSGQSVTLTAVPDSSSTFVGWSGGGCTGIGTCTVMMTGSLTVNATFGIAIPSLSQWSQYILMVLLFLSGAYWRKERESPGNPERL